MSKGKTVYVRIDKELHGTLLSLAEQRGETVSLIVRDAIRAYVRAEESRA